MTVGVEYRTDAEGGSRTAPTKFALFDPRSPIGNDCLSLRIFDASFVGAIRESPPFSLPVFPRADTRVCPYGTQILCPVCRHIENLIPVLSNIFFNQGVHRAPTHGIIPSSLYTRTLPKPGNLAFHPVDSESCLFLH